MNIDVGFLNLMTQDGTSKDDVKVPGDSDLGKQIQADFDEGKDLLATIVASMGEEQASSYKEAPRVPKSVYRNNHHPFCAKNHNSQNMCSLLSPSL